MTTRRGFIQGVLVAIGAAVMPRVAEARPINEPGIVLPHMKAPLVDNLGFSLDMDTLNASARNAADAIAEQAQAIDSGFVSIGDFTRVAVYYNGGCAEYHLDDPGWEPQFVITTQAPAERSKLLQDDKPTTFTSPFASPLEVPGSGKREVPDQH